MKIDKTVSARNAARVGLFRIEGETLSYAEIAARIGVSSKVVANRMKRLRGASGAITWERIGLVRNQEAA